MMPCDDKRRPKCFVPAAKGAAGELAAIIGFITSVFGVASEVIKAVPTAAEVAAAVAAALGGAAGGGAVSAAAGGLAVMFIAAYFAFRCNEQPSGLPECMSGVVYNIIPGQTSIEETLFPFIARHDRVDLVVKSIYWERLEDGGADVYCTDEFPPRRSEILRCIYYDQRACHIARAATVGAGIGAAAGVFAGAIAAAAIGCATIFFCLLALIVALLIGAVCALVGAFTAGNIAAATTPDPAPGGSTDSGVFQSITVGDLITVKGRMFRSSEEGNRNVLWVTETHIHGRISASGPFSHCDVDRELAVDACGEG